eukprot:gene29147-32367_t
MFPNRFVADLVFLVFVIGNLVDVVQYIVYNYGSIKNIGQDMQYSIYNYASIQHIGQVPNDPWDTLTRVATLGLLSALPL